MTLTTNMIIYTSRGRARVAAADHPRVLLYAGGARVARGDQGVALRQALGLHDRTKLIYIYIYIWEIQRT